MAKTTYLDIPDGYDLSYNKTLNSSDRFVFPSVRCRALFSRRRRIKGLTQKSLLPLCSQIWDSFTLETKNAWNVAGQVIGQSGYKLFVQDKVLREQNGLSGESIPNVLYQTYVGKLQIESPANILKITQAHPQQYWVSSPVHGKKGMREPVLVRENFALPLELQIAIKSDLQSTGVNFRARFFAIVYSLYQGNTIENVCEINFPLSCDWQKFSAIITKVLGKPQGYTLFIELYNVRGVVLVDNIVAEHSGMNWCRDSKCRDLDQNFTKAFYQVPKHWTALEISDGCFFGSEYYNNN